MNRSRVDIIVDRLIAADIPMTPIASAPWIDALEARWGGPIPEPYRALVRGWRFPAIELAHAELFGNLGDGSEDDLATRVFADPHMSTWLASQRCFPIGHPCLGDYDPLCLDAATRPKDNPPVVALDHEDILLGRSTVRRRMRWPSLLDCIADIRPRELQA